MRPIKLVMSGFCSYGGKNIEIPFDKLGENALYLISGETGAGKTTIFDAISFALFGEPSGSNREAKMLRSDYASNDVPTEVELTFEYSGHEYRVKRNPEYEIELPDGKTKKKSVDASLYKDGELVCTKAREVTNQIIDIIGLDRNQFSQIAMIAQGEFMKLITSSTKDRTEIFRKLFQTSGYLDFQERIKREAAAIKAELDGLTSSVNIYLEGVDCDEESILYADVEAVKANTMLAMEALEIVNKVIAEDKAKYEELQVKDTNNNSDIDKLNAQVTAVEEYNNNLIELKKKEEEFVLLEPEISAAEKAKAEAEGKKNDGLKSHTEAAKIKEDLSKYDLLDALDKKISSLKTEQNDAINLKKVLIERKDNAQNEINETVKVVDSLKDIEKEWKEISSSLEREKDKTEQLEGLNEEIIQLGNLEIEFEVEQNNYLEAQKKADKDNENYITANKAFLSEQAGIMAEALSDGKECPVCGSTHHPQLAKRSEAAPSEAELKDLEKVAKESLQIATSISKNAATLNGNIQTCNVTIIAKAKKLLNCEDIQKIKGIIDAEVENSRKALNLFEFELKNVEAKMAEKNDLEKSLVALRNSLEKMAEQITTNASSLANLEATIKEKEAQQKEISSGLKFDSKNDAILEIEKLESEYSKIETEIDKANNKLKDLLENKNVLIGKVQQLKDATKNAPKMDVNAIKAQLEELQIRRNMLKEATEKLSSRINTNSSVVANVSRTSNELSSVEEKYKWINALSKTANGAVEKKEKITFETYIQATYFDKVIRRANIRFDAMTAGQYQLVRSRETKNYQSHGALDLNVIDHHSGKERDVKSLSGGESFMASLALALGLADEVTATTGGIKLDTMFIDEGFGSLDGDTLEEAMRALNDLAQSNRLVGIISHVEALEKRIDNKIVVSKDANGSSVAKVITA